jgi:chromosomal replication initiator protein
MYAAYGQNTQAGIERLRQRQEAGSRDAAALVTLQRDLDEASRRIADMQIAVAREVSLKIPSTRLGRIKATACRVFKISPTQLISNRRDRHLVLARQFVMYWGYRLTPLSLPQIGRRIGGRDHTTILHGTRSYIEKRKAMGRHLRSVR